MGIDHEVVPEELESKSLVLLDHLICDTAHRQQAFLLMVTKLNYLQLLHNIFDKIQVILPEDGMVLEVLFQLIKIDFVSIFKFSKGVFA